MSEKLQCLQSYRLQRPDLSPKAFMARKDRKEFKWEESLAIQQSFERALHTFDVHRNSYHVSAMLNKSSASYLGSSLIDAIWSEVALAFHRPLSILRNEYDLHIQTDEKRRA